MVKAIVDVSDEANRVLNIVKAKYGLRTKSEAIEVVAEEYEKSLMAPGLRAGFGEWEQKVELEKKVKLKDLHSFVRKMSQQQ